MNYMGSKRRIAKHLLPFLLKDRKAGQYYVEPFVGGANMIGNGAGIKPKRATPFILASTPHLLTSFAYGRWRSTLY
jgi:DNA adenine methylase